MPLVAHALTQVSAVETVVGAGTFTAERIEQQINAVTDRFERYCTRRFQKSTHTEVIPGNGRWLLPLRNYPILSVDSVQIDGSAITDYDLTDKAINGLLYRLTTWPASLARHPDLTGDPDVNSAKPNIRVVYEAGYELTGGNRTLPYDLEQACIDLVVCRLLHPVPGVQQERTAGGHSTTWRDDLPPEILAVINSYRGSIR